jgi:hypothetical protein
MTNDFPLIQADLRERDGQLRLVKGLTEQWLSIIRLLLEGQSSRDLNAFDAAIGRLMNNRYRLTSLVVELRCASSGPDPKMWSFEVRPKIGAKPKPLRQA